MVIDLISFVCCGENSCTKLCYVILVLSHFFLGNSSLTIYTTTYAPSHQ
jgi:hypothetical protein